jgi:hypothetical protein
MVQWLAPTFDAHKKRLFGACRGSYQSTLYLDTMREKHSKAGKLPEFLESLVAPKALDGLPSLQAVWDEIHTQYKQSLFQALVNSRQEKLATQYSPAVREQIVKSLVADTKRLIAEKSQADPAHKDTFEAEGKATCSLFNSSVNHWEQEAKDQALAQFQRQQSQKETTESQALEQANVSSNSHNLSSNTNPPQDPDSPATHHHSHPKIPPLSEGSSTSQRQGQGEGSWSTERLLQRQLQRRNLKRKRSKQGKSNVNTLDLQPVHTNTQLVHTLTKSKPNRRLSKAQKNKIKARNNLSADLKLEQAELQLMKSNLRQIGVAQKQVHNLTGNTIPQGALNCLALGTKFISVPNPDPSILLTSIKKFRRTIRLRHIFQDDDNNVIPQYWLPSSWNPPYLDQRRDIEYTINQLQNSIAPSTTPIQSNINKTDIAQYNKLLHDPNLLVILADKNLGYAVVTKSWYLDRCLEHLNSASYTKITDQYQAGIENKSTIDFLTEKLTNLVIDYQYHLTTDEIKWILQKPKDQWEPMKFYITAKVHKTPIKGRPIVPSMTWLTFHLSQWLANQLNPLLPATEWVLKDSYDLLASIKQINDTNLPDTIKVATADVDALYPSMDIVTGLQLVKSFLEQLDWENQQKRDFLIKAMEFVLTNGYITFQGEIYQQTNGAAMGSPMIPPYANIFMYQLEKQTVHTYTNSGTILLYKRFIDDVFIVTKDSNTAQLQNELNNLNPSIKLTWTPPSKHCNFLDITVTIKNNKLQTNVYQKELNTYAYLPFHSYHTTAQKRGFIKGEAIRYARICTTESDFKTMIKLFTLRLQRRGYPLSFIQRSLGQVQHKDRHKYTVQASTNKKQKVIPLLFKTEYNPSVSHKNLRTALNQFTVNVLKLANIHPSISQKVTICYKMPPKLHTLSLKARKRKGL